MISVTIHAKVPFESSTDMFSCPKILDSIHGIGLWKFTDWKVSPEGSYTRKGKIKGVEVPSFARFLNGGKRYITCNVTQTYTQISEDTIIVDSLLKPKVAGVNVVLNETQFKIKRFDSTSSLVYVSSHNQTDLPHPLRQIAIEVMDDMSIETMNFLEDALAQRFR